MAKLFDFEVRFKTFIIILCTERAQDAKRTK